MAFRILSLLALCLLSLYYADAFKAANWPKTEPKLVGFSWKNCGSASDPIQVKSLDVSPDPIKVPGDVTAGVSFSIASAGPTDVAVAITMEKKVAGFFIKVPCVDNVGSCTYGDICKDWAEACPKYFAKFGIPCTCPIPPNTYTIPDTVVDITSKLPAGAQGEFRVTANMVSPTAGHLGCIEIDANLA